MGDLSIQFVKEDPKNGKAGKQASKQTTKQARKKASKQKKT
jgi:hypothetical protein